MITEQRPVSPAVEKPIEDAPAEFFQSDQPDCGGRGRFIKHTGRTQGVFYVGRANKICIWAQYLLLGLGFVPVICGAEALLHEEL